MESLDAMADMIEHLVDQAVEKKLETMEIESLPAANAYLPDEKSLVEGTETEVKVVEIPTKGTNIKISVTDDVFEMDLGDGQLITGKAKNLTMKFFSKPEKLASEQNGGEYEVIEIVAEDQSEPSTESDYEKTDTVLSALDEDSGVILQSNEEPEPI